jgi:hypothetical protein
VIRVPGVKKMSKTRIVGLGMIFAYAAFLALFSTSYFFQELTNGNITGQLLFPE